MGFRRSLRAVAAAEARPKHGSDRLRRSLCWRPNGWCHASRGSTPPTPGCSCASTPQANWSILEISDVDVGIRVVSGALACCLLQKLAGLELFLFVARRLPRKYGIFEDGAVFPSYAITVVCRWPQWLGPRGDVRICPAHRADQFWMLLCAPRSGDRGARRRHGFADARCRRPQV